MDRRFVAGLVVGALALGTVIGPGVAGAGGRKVVVKNKKGSPVPVRETKEPSHRTPAQYQLGFAYSGASIASASIQVPEGKRLEIDFASLHDLNRAAGIKRLTIRTTVNGTTVNHYISSVPQPDSGDAGSVMTKIYADPGTFVEAHLLLTTDLGGSGSTSYMYGSLSGTLVDV